MLSCFHIFQFKKCEPFCLQYWKDKHDKISTKTNSNYTNCHKLANYNGPGPKSAGCLTARPDFVDRLSAKWTIVDFRRFYDF